MSVYLGFAGAGMGSYIAARQRSHQFLAENAHRLPKTQRGWYVYHRHKQLESIRAALSWKGGLGNGAKFATMGAIFCGLEALLETHVTQERECWVNAVGAGTICGALFAAGTRLSLQSSKYALAMGAGTGLAIGLLEDVSAYVSGVSLKYPSKLRSGSLDLWIPGWDWEKGLAGFGVFRRSE
ncbi:hypothetical protein BCR33DRAFT_715062 [Rhizoclosmatium globosum]|uniref:Uncharacterized protein n=1 Tax=Rhizoclosmatium globosum TaxID=329046 RepID=A0A1Y2CJX7_9FUNG|nr:hypothetical protein BCR33DRAFT_715062 [Rhizoclosmatium globosum]|eukprot:ORY47318.1 hypothetical protein BCR33DRAFT_715062 [Rhizoclosmatium globosum]